MTNEQAQDMISLLGYIADFVSRIDKKLSAAPTVPSPLPHYDFDIGHNPPAVLGDVQRHLNCGCVGPTGPNGVTCQSGSPDYSP